MDEFKVNPYGKFLSDTDGDLTLELAWREDKNSDGLNDALVKITGAAAYNEGIDGRVLYYKAVPAGTGFNLTYIHEGQEYVRMITRDPQGLGKTFEATVDGQKFRVTGDEKKSKDVRPLHLLTAFKKSL